MLCPIREKKPELNPFIYESAQALYNNKRLMRYRKSTFITVALIFFLKYVNSNNLSFCPLTLHRSIISLSCSTICRTFSFKTQNWLGTRTQIRLSVTKSGRIASQPLLTICIQRYIAALNCVL